MLAAAFRALPAGLLVLGALALLAGRNALPRGRWWWRAPILGVLNIGVFFALLFVRRTGCPGASQPCSER